MPPLPTTIRQARSSDAVDLFAVHQSSVHAFCASDYSAEHLATWFTGRSADMYAPAIQAEQLWVAETNEGIVGFVRAEPGEVTLLFVAPKAAGRAIGSRLLEFGLMRAAENFHGPLTVIATKNSAPFYRRFGFNHVEEQSFVRGSPPLHYPVVKMELKQQSPLQAARTDA